MFKRFQVFDLLFGSEETTVALWINPNDELPKQRNGVFKVKLNDGNEIDAYYVSDMAVHLCTYGGIKPTYWWNRTSKQPLYNVTQWGRKTVPFTRKKTE